MEAFNLGGSAAFVPGGSKTFVPKSKMPVVEIPVIGSRADQPAEVEDPCYGEQKEFFIYEFNEKKNVCICRFEQMSFIAAHYPEYYMCPIDILIWLYDVASYDENLLAEQAVYSAPKSN